MDYGRILSSFGGVNVNRRRRIGGKTGQSSARGDRGDD
jgi:hypothetical protein